MSIFQQLLSRDSAQPGKTISPEEVKNLFKEDRRATLLDVRTLDEYRKGHIDGSTSLPLDSLPGKVEKLVADKTAPVVVYCLSGGRSATAAGQLSKMGYSNVYNMGGVGRWPYGIVK